MFIKPIKKLMMRVFRAISPFEELPAQEPQESKIDHHQRHYRRAKRAARHLGTDRAARAGLVARELEQ